MLNERRTTRHHSNLREWWTTFLAIEHSSFAYRSLHFSLFFFSLSFFHTLQSACPSRKSIIFSFSEQIFVNPFGNEEYRAAATRKWLISGLMTCRRLMDTYGFWFRFNYAKIFHFQTRSIICEIYITLAPSYHS